MILTTYINNSQSILQMSGDIADLPKRTNIRKFVRFEKGSFVTFRIFVSAIVYYTEPFSRR